jgi:hypothetical protein
LAAFAVLAAAAALLLPAPGSSNAERAIRRALTAGTGVVELPDGVLEISRGFEIPQAAHDLEIRGAASGGSLVRASAHFRGRALFQCERASGIRFSNFAIDGNLPATEVRTGLPPSNVAFEKFTQANGILAAGVNWLTVSRVRFIRISGFAILASRSRDVTISGVVIDDSGSRNARGGNNATGGILIEEGTADFRVIDCELRNIRGNGIWTHSLYTSPRNANGQIKGNHFDTIGRDAIQVGHATNVRVEDNSGSRVGFPADAIDVEGRAIPVAIDTAGNTSQSVYIGNRFEEINGKCIDLDGFHHGEVRANQCVNRQVGAAYRYGNYGIVMNNSNPDMQSEQIAIQENEIDGTLFGGIFVIGSGHRVAHNRLRRINLAHCNENAAQFGCYYAAGQPDLLRAGIYLGSGAERPAPARDNVVADNEISGFQMRAHCILAAPGVLPGNNKLERNVCRDEDH